MPDIDLITVTSKVSTRKIHVFLQTPMEPVQAKYLIRSDPTLHIARSP